MTRAIIVKREGAYIVAAEGAAVVGSLTAQARVARDAAAASAALAESASGPTYANTTAGIAATTDGQAFAVDNGDGTVTVYLNDSGSAVAQRTLATTALLASSAGSEAVGFLQSGSGSVARTSRDKMRDVVSVKDFGAAGDGVTTDAAAINLALTANAGGTVEIPASSGSYIIEATIVIPDFTELVGFGWGVTLKRGFVGPMFKLGRQSKIRNFVVDGNSSGYPGTGNDTIVVEVGENSPTPSLQGHQVIEQMAFINTPGYPVHYTVAGMGWMSKVEGCFFQGTSSDAAVKWPDDGGGGGNRKVILCYSDVPIVNVGGCGNGIISFNTTYGSATTNQGIIFPAGETNRANKVIVTSNRFAIASGTINIRGVDHVFSDNIVAGSVVFEDDSSDDGATDCVWGDSNTITGTLTDSSGAANKITFSTPVSFTPTITASGGGFAMGNADVRCEYTRSDNWISANYFIKIGSTTTLGTGSWTISIPVNRYSGGNTDYVGNALALNYACGARTLFQVGTDGLQLLTPGAGAVGAASPGAWASGDLLLISIRYRIF